MSNLTYPDPDNDNDTTVDSGEAAPPTHHVGPPPGSMDHNSEFLANEPQD